MAPQTIDRAAHNTDLVKTGYAAFARGDLMTVQAFFDPDAVWHAQRLGRLGGDHSGWPAVLKFFAESMELTQGTFRIDVEEIMANDTGAAAVIRSNGRRGEQVLDDRQVHLFRLEGDRVTEVWQFVGDGATVESFWS